MKIIYPLLICAVSGSCNSPKPQPAPQQAVNETTREKMITTQLTNRFVGHSGAGEYVIFTDSTMQHMGHSTYSIKSVQPKTFATVMSAIIPDKCIGKRVEFSAWVKGSDIKGSAGLWLRIDPDKGFDNMSRRPIQGTFDWTRYHVVLDVPEGSTVLAYGLLLAGNGQVWVDSMNVTITDKNMPRTDSIGVTTL